MYKLTPIKSETRIFAFIIPIHFNLIITWSFDFWKLANILKNSNNIKSKNNQKIIIFKTPFVNNINNQLSLSLPDSVDKMLGNLDVSKIYFRFLFYPNNQILYMCHQNYHSTIVVVIQYLVRHCEKKI